MAYHFRVGRVVQNDPLKLVVIVKKLLDIVGRVVKKYQKLLDTLGRWFLKAPKHAYVIKIDVK